MPSAVTAARVLDGVAIASEIKSEVAREVQAARNSGYTPGLAVVLVGENPASQIYVRSKIKASGELGIYSEMHTPPASITTEELLALVHSLNAREDIDGILIQLPLPEHVDTSRLLEAVVPEKDVDGFHPINAGRLLSGAPMDTVLAPCTPAGIMEILKRSGIPISGANAVVVGRSNIVGKPIAAMLINASATVTVCHSRTHDLPKITREADILSPPSGAQASCTATWCVPAPLSSTSASTASLARPSSRASSHPSTPITSSAAKASTSAGLQSSAMSTRQPSPSLAPTHRCPAESARSPSRC